MTSLGINRILLLTLIFTCLILSLVFFNNSIPYNKASRLILSKNVKQDNYTQYPGSFVEQLHPIPSNFSYCNFNYGFPFELNQDYDDLSFGPEQGNKSPYRVIYNVVEAKISGLMPSVTYATHVTADFVSYIPELIRHWDGLISVAAFVPDTDVALVMERINQYCYCLPGMSRVSVHIVYHKKLPPSRRDIYFTRPLNCKVDDSSKLETYRSFDDRVTYPINVCRNAARTASLTEHVIVSDIQLLPSENLGRKFWDMMQTFAFTECPHKVFVVPIFEIEETVQDIPRTKRELVQLIRQGKAVYFHKLVCSHCQKFPGIESWMETDPGDVVTPLLTARREVPYHRWEPIYIGTKDEPFYNEKLSWEGLQDKMLQESMLEMCLIGYKFVILDGAFLVHWPGIKKTKILEETWRSDFVTENTMEYKNILTQLAMKYNLNPQCKLA
ncbi:hypothetical protein NQ317_008121 [Molorchus minor]|uniref:N-acetyllactosaminide beta-1,3-N-acetylglucosaminyltransferase n=1 Tax=Molorchus minor TaxID=1323400 RepID=A0ABQ9IZ26_9CUCU|nr:hypothetical protein NQ317_008121 [Molorchus minor]